MFFNTTQFDETMKPDAIFAQARLETYTLYSCANNLQNQYPTTSLGYHLTSIDSVKDIETIVWPEQAELIGNISGSSNTIEDMSIQSCYNIETLPVELPWGYYIDIYWDGEFVEDFIIQTEQ